MSTILTKTYLITSHTNKVEGFISKLIASNTSFEVLDARELGEEWDSIQNYKPEKEFDEKELELSEKILVNYQPKGFLNSFEDNRAVGSLAEILDAKSNSKVIKEIIHKLNEYLELETDEKGKGDATNAALEDVKSFLKQHNIDPENFTKENYKLIAAYHTSIELDIKLSHSLGKIFTTEENSNICFAFVTVDQNSHSTFETILNSDKITFEKIDWNREIVVWKNKGGLAAFQTVAQSLGTISTKEVDPTIAISLFFSLFFAFCLNDAVYGLILSGFTGYFLYFRNLKPGFKNIFQLFFFSGLLTILLGALTNSWAGDFFSQTPVNNVLQNFQLIDTLNVDSTAPINVFLKNELKTSPIVFMLGLSGFIGILSILSGYVLKILNSLKSKDGDALKADTSWFLFILSILATTVTAALAPSLTNIGLISVLIFGISLFVFNSGKGIFGKVLGGLGSIYGLIGFFADVLSFTRLIAVGLTGGIIANVINLLAKLIYDSINVPIINLIAAIIVLLIGHSFNLVVSLFGAYINPLRLHYVEFMPKFFEGRGRSLQPVNAEFTFMKLELKSK